MAYDLVIKNGMVMDGTGAPGRRADVGISGGKVVEIGKISDAAAKVLDASDRIVAPGFVDPHTHYDAQISWDPSLTPTSWHGVTTAVMGNCGVGVAPCRPEMRESTAHDLVNVEGIPYSVLEKGLGWEWESFPQYMDAADRRDNAVNLACLLPITPLRQYVMGEEASDRAATPEELAKLKDVIREALDAGAIGISHTVLSQHRGHGGKKLGCQLASREELAEYARVLKQANKGMIEMALTAQASIVTDDEYDLLDMLLTESGRQVSFAGILQRDDLPNACDDMMEKIKPLLRRGAIPQTLARPLTREFNLKTAYVFTSFPCFARVLQRPKAEQLAIYNSAEFRNAFREDLKTPRAFNGDWSRVTVISVQNPALKPLELLSIAEIAKRQGKDGIDAIVDLVVQDDLETEFKLAFLNVTPHEVQKLLENKDILIALGDGGAHVDLNCDAGYTTYFLGTWVRERQIMSWEDAIMRLTSQPADVYGLKGRGRLKVRSAADVVVFDPNTIGSDENGEKRYDLPGNAMRFVVKSRGIDTTIVNGAIMYHDGKLTGRSEGRVVRI